ncbi:hypothetical protein [Corynebacterium crudilactis]|uniref:DUF4253 domain-containing protein n=1 Tax=Corynebacterium crudilactis TaxID=1652495 RepID=A0A172QVA1_9CORY|nr:hypothetical protein [Corynebacterium crudilactis]ANE04643.1 hypothetical protein ccrud_10790 [Corynebacterium crudilactis]
MPAIPEIFESDLFPEISGTKEFRGLTYIFFDQFTLPTSEQLEQVPGWSVFTWGWWNAETDLDDADLEEITFDGDRLSQLSEISSASALNTFSLTEQGLPNGEREPQLIESAEILTAIFAEEGTWGLVAISCPNWQVPAACEWLGCMNIAEPHEMALALKAWQTGWGVEALAFGGEEDDADLLLRIPDEHADNAELINAFAVAADQVRTFKHEDLGLLASLWFD